MIRYHTDCGNTQVLESKVFGKIGRSTVVSNDSTDVAPPDATAVCSPPAGIIVKFVTLTKLSPTYCVQ